MNAPILVDDVKLAALVTLILSAAGMPESEARIVSDCMVDADLSNVSSHGVSRVRMYLSAMREGGIRPRFTYDLVRDAPSVAVLDVKGSHGIMAAYTAMNMAIEKAGRTGIAMINVRDSNHCGATGYFARLAASKGMIGIATSNAPENMAPWGSAEKFLGTNPLAIAIPTRSAPFSLDMATSTVARGKIILANKLGKAIPLGWAIDANGEPTTDAAEALKGSVLPFGGAKGSGIAMAIDIICGVLSQSGFGHNMFDANKYFDRPNHTGHSCAAVDISKFMDYEEFIASMDKYIEDLGALRPAAGFEAVVLPGALSAASRSEKRENGIELSSPVYDELKAFAGEFSVPFDIVKTQNQL